MRHKGRDRTSAIAHFGLDWQRCLATTSTASQNESVRVPFWSASIVETSLSHLKSVSSALGRYLQKHQAPRVVERGVVRCLCKKFSLYQDRKSGRVGKECRSRWATQV